MTSKFGIMWKILLPLLFVHLSVHCEELDEACKGKGPVSLRVIEKGTIYSPGFLENQNYPPNVKCSYQLHAPTGMHVRLKFNFLDIDPVEDCKADSLGIIEFQNGANGIEPILIKTHCGRDLPQDYVSSWQIFQLDFISDSSGSGRGFSITYSAEFSDEICSEDEKKCTNRKCVQLEDVCDGIDDCGDGSDEEGCKRPVIQGVCGRPEIDPLTDSDYDRIVGGETAIPGSWPWMVEIQPTYIEPGHFCGGTLINNQWVLSAAHCFGTYRKPKDLRIHLGKHRKYYKDDHEQIRNAKKLIIYNDIDPEIFEDNGAYDLTHDIALIQLNAPVQFTKYVKPACLPDMNLKLNSRSQCFATGWGYNKGIGSDAYLKQTYHPIHPDRTCARKEFVPQTMICAGSMAANDGICKGDSGGPLICKINDEWTVVGVSSYIQGDCGSQGLPSVFNKVSVKVEYIRDMIAKYSK